MMMLVWSCKTSQSNLEKWTKALGSCDYGETCRQAFEAVGHLEPALAESPEGIAARMQRLKVELGALASFPPGMDGFLDKAGLSGIKAFKDMKSEATALKTSAELAKDLDESLEIMDFLGAPDCDGFKSVQRIIKNGGAFADTASMVAVSALAQIFISIGPDTAHMYGEVARSLIGCTLAGRSSAASILVEARNLFYDQVEQCSTLKPVETAYRSTCDEARKLAKERALPLPFPDIGAGDLLGAMLPRSIRGAGISVTPPWALVLTAGRLGIWHQTILDAGVRKSAAVVVKPMIDLRKPHIGDDVFYAVRQAFKTRKDWEFNGTQMCPVIVDRSTTASELFEALDGLFSESKAIPMIATAVAGRVSPTFVPVNYRISRRTLVDSLGARAPFGKDAPIEATLSPFTVDLDRLGTSRHIEIGNDFRAKAPDLRAVYKAVLDLVKDHGSLPLRLKVGPTVPTGLLMRVIQTLALRVPPANLETARTFQAALPLRRPDGRFDQLISLFVLMPAD
ncbi:MAG: hypothetical protein GXP54_05935 [Deltaproteobacteria bacterium]|nr:hypothetical protein [Deltaproteobacteria bacterium]